MRKLPSLLLLLLLSGCRKDQPAPAPGTTGAAVKVAECVREENHRRLRLVVPLANTGATPLTTGPPVVQLLAGEQPVPPFIAPGLEPAVIAPGQTAEVETHWWLPEDQAGASLTLVANGTRHPVVLPP